MIANISGHYDVVVKLIENGADVNFADENGTSSIYFAAQNGNIKVPIESNERSINRIRCKINRFHLGFFQVIRRL